MQQGIAMEQRLIKKRHANKNKEPANDEKKEYSTNKSI
jgi:hypothetical protein